MIFDWFFKNNFNVKEKNIVENIAFQGKFGNSYSFLCEAKI